MQDFLLDEHGDLKIEDNDLVYAESSEQHQRLLLLCNKGDFKENPTAGVGLLFYLKDESTAGLMAAVKTEFESDGMRINEIKIEDSQLKVNATYSD